MNWKREAEERLRDYKYRKQSLDGMRMELEQLNQSLGGIRSASLDGMPSYGGGNGREDALLNTIIKRDELQRSIRDTEFFVKRIEGALSQMDDTQKLILDKMYINRYKNAAFDLAEELHVEKTQVYARRDKAIRQFTMLMFGDSCL